MNVISKIPYFHGTDQKSLEEMKKQILDSIINLGIKYMRHIITASTRTITKW